MWAGELRVGEQCSLINGMTEVDPLIESLYRWSDVSGVLLMGIIGGTIARKRGYDIIGFFLHCDVFFPGRGHGARCAY